MKRYRKTVRTCLENLELQRNVIGHPEADSCRELMRHARKLKSRELEGMAHYYNALFCLHQGQQEEGINCLAEALRCLENTECYDKIADSYNIMGFIAHGQNNPVLAIDNYNSALAYCSNHGLKAERLMVESNIAGAYYRVRDYGTAAGYYEKCLQEYRIIKDTSQRNEWNYLCVLASFGNCLAAMKRYEEAAKLEAEIWEMLYYHPSIAVPKLAVYTFFAVMRGNAGEENRAEEYADIAIRSMKENSENLIQHDNILGILNYLADTGQTGKLGKVLEFLEKQNSVESNEGFLLQLLLMRLQYCGEEMPKEDYLKYVNRFFELRNRYEKEEHRQILRTVELRTKLRDMRKEQQNITLQNEELMQKSLHDEVSGLPNRRYLMKRAEEMLHSAAKGQEPFAVVLVDVDYFKEYNDAYGHHEGDICIRTVAGILRDAAKEEGFTARYGGDEFVLLFEGKSPEQMTEIMLDIKEKIGILKMIHKDAEGGYVSVSQGCVDRIPGEGTRLWDYMSAADRALYYRKNHGKNGYYMV